MMVHRHDWVQGATSAAEGWSPGRYRTSKETCHVQGDNFKEDGQRILADFHSWVQGGASGAEG